MGAHQHAYVYAAAAIVDQFDRNLCAPEGTPGRIAVEAAIVQTCTRLGCRQHPLQWEPTHLQGILNEELLVEAWLVAKMRLKTRMVVTKYGKSAKGPMNEMAKKWGAENRGPLLWEGEHACKFERVLAAAGMANWGDVTNKEGEWATWNELSVSYQIGFTGEGYQAAHQRLITALGRVDNRITEEWKEKVENGSVE